MTMDDVDDYGQIIFSGPFLVAPVLLRYSDHVWRKRIYWRSIQYDSYDMTHMIWRIWYDSYKWFLEYRNVLDYYRNDQPKNYVLSGHLIGVLILYFKMLFLMFRKRSLIHDDANYLIFKGSPYSPEIIINI